MTRLAIFSVLALLAGCGGEPTRQPQPTPSPTASGYIARVQALPEGQRRGVLFRAIRGGTAGASCQGVTKTEAVAPDASGRPGWRVTCDEGGRFFVSLSDDGTAEVTSAPAK